MRAVVYTESGDSSVLELVEREGPEPGPGEVRVRVEAGEGLPLRAVQLQLRGEDGGLSLQEGFGLGEFVGLRCSRQNSLECRADEVGIQHADHLDPDDAGGHAPEAGFGEAGFGEVGLGEVGLEQEHGHEQAQEVVRIPQALSPSRASDFQNCPLLYRFRTIDRLPEAPSPAAVRGTLVHELLEGFDLGPGAGTAGGQVMFEGGRAAAASNRARTRSLGARARAARQSASCAHVLCRSRGRRRW